MRDICLKIILGCVLLGAVLIVAQIWGVILSGEIFFKILMTLGVVIVVSGLVVIIKSDLGSAKDLKDNNYLD